MPARGLRTLAPAIRFASALTLRAAVLGLVGLGLVACGQTRAASLAPDGTPAPAIFLDGDTTEWPVDVQALADDHYLYLRLVDMPGDQALQASNTTTTLEIDADDNPATGDGGIDLRIELSPPTGNGRAGSGALIKRYNPNGTFERIGHAEISFMFAPSFASTEYEFRIARTHSAGLADVSDAVVYASAGLPAPARVTMPGPAKSPRPDGFTGPFFMRPAAAAPNVPSLSARRAGPMRVMSWNVLQSSPVNNPEPFARVLRATQPDAVLLQEWVNTDTDRLETWFEDNVGGEWFAHKDTAWGVAIASRYPLTPTLEPLTRLGDNRPIRAARAVADTPWGRVLLVSTHLKCCGGANSGEDNTRMAEAGIINAWIRANSAALAGVVVGGDLNLVGTRRPLDLLADGIDLDGSDLAPVRTPVGWDSAIYTWREASSSFTPGRLDWVLISDSSFETRAFVFDTAKMDLRSARTSGVQRTDTDASDHLPIIVDLSPVN